MTPIHADQLPRHVKARLGLPQRAKPSRAGTGGPQRTTCVPCGEVFERFEAAEVFERFEAAEVFERFEAAERHARAEHGGGRLDIDLTGGT